MTSVLAATTLVATMAAVPLARADAGDEPAVASGSALARVDAGDQRAVAPANAVAASWFPDGKSLVYVNQADGPVRLVRQSLTSTVAYPLGTETYVLGPTVSPDGDLVAYTKVTADFESRNTLRILEVDNGAVTDFHSLTGLYATRTGGWSPDGSHLVFAGKVSYESPWRIYTATLAGTELTAISDVDDVMPLDPTWSPAGGAIAFTDYGSTNQDLRIVNPDGSDERSVADGAISPSFSPDGTKIAAMFSGERSQIKILDPDDGSVIQALTSTTNDQQPAWSPDGSYLAFTRATESATGVWIRSFGPDIPPAVAPKPPTVSIDKGAVYTDSRSVTLSIRPPIGATSVTVANDGGFDPAETFEVTTAEQTILVPWKLRSSGSERLPKIVYVRFDGFDTVVTDDIILDETDPVISSLQVSEPSGSKGRAAAAARTRVLSVKASDNRSGVSRIQYGRKATSRGAHTARFRTRTSIPAWSTTYVRVQDKAGNWCAWRKAKPRRG